MAETEFSVDALKDAERCYRVVCEVVDGLFQIYRLADRARDDALEGQEPEDRADIRIFCELIMRLAEDHGRALDHEFGAKIGCFDREEEVAHHG